jgi:hypothetical protein
MPADSESASVGTYVDFDIAIDLDSSVRIADAETPY